MGSGSSRGKKVAPACVSEARLSGAGRPGVRPSAQAGGPVRQQPDSRGQRPGSDQDTPPRRTFTRTRTHGLCPFSGGDTEDEPRCPPRLEETRDPRRDGDQRSRCVFTHRKKVQPAGFTQRHLATQNFSAGGPFLESAPAVDKQQTSGASAAILYDGSEEELMDTIERDFS